MKNTILLKTDKLPLTCSRKGTCCFGKAVFINPWEITQLAKSKNVSVKEFIESNCEEGGIQLKFDGQNDRKGQNACSLYVDNFGCSVHTGRPLACRLYPLGRQIQNGDSKYIYEGKTFPCLSDCKEVLNLPQLTVDAYLSGQEVDLFEQAQDEYLEVVQNLADIALTLVLDTELNSNQIMEIIENWKVLKNESAFQLSQRISIDFLELLITPSIINSNNTVEFIRTHNEIIQEKAQQSFETFNSTKQIMLFASEIMASTLLLSKSIGADSKSLLDLWVKVVRYNIKF